MCVCLICFSTCFARTRLYHTLLHYKYRLLLSVRDRLGRHHHGSISQLMQDDAFLQTEIERYETLLEMTQKWSTSSESSITYTTKVVITVHIWMDAGAGADANVVVFACVRCVQKSLWGDSRQQRQSHGEDDDSDDDSS